MPTGRTQGWLLLADISGYTSFLTGTELEHAHDILQDLMRGLLKSFRAPIRVVKLEGDAVFAYALDTDVPDGRAIVDRLEDSYHAFRMELFNIERSTTCTCRACKAAPSMDLKFMVHRGEFVVHDLAGHDDLQGPDVIVVHRLLKNDVPDKLGKRAYVLATEAARQRISGLAWIAHTETYEHIGEVRCGVRCMHEAYALVKEQGNVDLGPDAQVRATFDVDLPPPVVWDWHVDEDKAWRWQGDLTAWRVGTNGGGRKGLGSTVHCAHGDAEKAMKIVSWRPFRSVTFDSEAFGRIPSLRFTVILEPLDGGERTRVHWRGSFHEKTWKNRFSGG